MSRTNMDTRHAHSALLAAPQSATANSRSSNSSSESSSNKNNINVGVGDDSGNVSAVSIEMDPTSGISSTMDTRKITNLRAAVSLT